MVVIVVVVQCLAGERQALGCELRELRAESAEIKARREEEDRQTLRQEERNLADSRPSPMGGALANLGHHSGWLACEIGNGREYSRSHSHPHSSC